MKCVIIGLGNFGSSLAERLTKKGHEIIGVDNRMEKVEALKEQITHTICLDSTDSQSVSHLPLRDADIVVVAIGEDEGANIMTTALMKQYKVKRLISRAVSPLHETVLQAMGVDEIVHPEEETAERWAKKLNISNIIDSFEVTAHYNIIEAKVPRRYIGRQVKDVGFRRNYNVVLLTTIKMREEKNILGVNRRVTSVQGVATSQTWLEEDDILVLYGDISDIEKLLKGGE
jgi:trk system potassium uptake protein TrkA